MALHSYIKSHHSNSPIPPVFIYLIPEMSSYLIQYVALECAAMYFLAALVPLYMPYNTYTCIPTSNAQKCMIC